MEPQWLLIGRLAAWSRFRRLAWSLYHQAEGIGKHREQHSGAEAKAVKDSQQRGAVASSADPTGVQRISQVHYQEEQHLHMSDPSRQLSHGARGIS